MIHNFLVNYDKNKTITKVEHSNLEYATSFIKKIFFYNVDVNEPLHKFWYFIPKAKIIKKMPVSNNPNVGSGSYNTIKIAISNKEENLISSIKSLDDVSKDIIKKILDEVGNSNQIPESLIESPNYPTTMDIILVNQSKCFDIDKNEITFADIKNGNKVQLFIEFDSVVVESRQITKRWRIIQMKELQDVDLNIDIFDIMNSSINTSNVTYIPNTPTIYNPSYNTSYNTYNDAPPPPPPPMFTQASYSDNLVSVDQLRSIKLKSNTPYDPLPPVQKKPTTAASFLPPTQSELLNALGKLKKREIVDIPKVEDIKPIEDTKSIEDIKSIQDIKSINMSLDILKLLKKEKHKLNDDKIEFNKIKKRFYHMCNLINDNENNEIIACASN